MSTPAPHTPINFVKGGANMAWSAACVRLIAEAGFHPDDFGSHSYVQARCRQARQKVAEYDRYEAHGRGEQLEPPYGRGPNEPHETAPPKPTPHERFLAGSQAGHLTQAATQTRDRNDPCANVVDGWDTSLAPCMPHHGSASQEGTMHCEITRLEDQQARRNGRKPNDPYPSRATGATGDDTIEAHERERIDAALKHHRDNTLPQGTAQDKGSGASTSTQTPAQAGYFGGEDPGAAPATADPKAKVIDGQSAGECIENFKNAATEAMKAEMSNDDAIARNAAAAADADTLRERADEALAERNSERSRQGWATRRLEAQLHENINSGLPAAERREALRRLRDLRNARDASRDRTNRLSEVYEERDAAARRAERARCREMQGRRLAGKPDAGAPRQQPRVPRENPNLPENAHLRGRGTRRKR